MLLPTIMNTSLILGSLRGRNCFRSCPREAGWPYRAAVALKQPIGWHRRHPTYDGPTLHEDARIDAPGVLAMNHTCS